MTGTATGHEHEFYRFYKLPIVSIPLCRPCGRKLEPTRYFKSEDDKWKAIADDVAARQQTGQPVLIGTRTIANSRNLASLLTHHGVPFRLLNGMQDQDEAALIAAAGELGAVTIATNMAGRGTDIKPAPAALLRGGLHVISAAPNDSQRIDRQLVGRAARQGDPGSCQCYVSADDALILQSGAKLVRLIETAANNEQMSDECDAAIRQLQQNAERSNYQRRLQLLNQEIWLDALRTSVA
jgi:preprotein translocase subunit SecA